MLLNRFVIRQLNQLGQQKIPFLFIIDFDGSELTKIIPLSELKQHPNIQFNINGIHNLKPIEQPFSKDIILNTFPISYERYCKAFEYCIEHLRYGNSYLLNLTFPTKIETNLTLQEIFDYSKAKYKLHLNHQFVCFSPETFVQIKNGIISSNPMKGTISAHTENAENVLLESKKEFEEHATIVDLIRNDLNQVAKKVKVEQFRYLDYIPTQNGELIQVSSKISGQLPNDYHQYLGDILAKLLPAGSITGAPKRKTIEIIKTAEQYERGFYTGIFGYFDGQNLDSAVMIRFIENINGQFYFKSGGGITTQSNASAEYQELIDKVYVPIRNH
jgi:para-aminobenzoate synthetase component I